MTQKRKSEVTALEETDRTLYPTFCSAANSLSQLYGQVLNQQKLIFHAGERHALKIPELNNLEWDQTMYKVKCLQELESEKLNEWITMRQQDGVRITGEEISAYLQSELDNSGVEAPFSPISQRQQYLIPNSQMSSAPSSQMQQGAFIPATGLQGPSMEFNMDQSKNSVFPDALSTPVKGSTPFEVADYSEMVTRCMQLKDQEL